MTHPKADKTKAGWRAPTRRAFVGMLAAGAAALAARSPVPRGLATGNEDDDADRPRSTWAGTTRWIGHC